MSGSALLPCRVCSREPVVKRERSPDGTLIRCHHHTRNVPHTVAVFYKNAARAAAAWNRLNERDAARGGDDGK